MNQLAEKKKKLNLQWVSDVIGDEFLKWRKRDIVKIQAQTGTGKTYFIKKCLIPNLADYERLLYICNRTNLKRQLKKDLMEQFNIEIPYLKNENGEYILDKNENKILDIESIDSQSTFGNVTITSYHAIQNSILDHEYELGFYDLDYDYIVMDECHYMLSDGAFNNQTRLAFDELIRNKNFSAVKIFISATMDEINMPIKTMLEGWFGITPKLWEYTTGIDYSYLNTKYFMALKDMITTIKNDTTDEKWLIFVSDLRDAKRIKDEVGEDKCSIIKAGDKSDELKNIIDNSKFNSKILITTKAMDNGVNFSDDKLKNIVIMAWDKITFIQMLGRKRIDIEEAQEVNLYIPTRYKKSFLSKMKDCKVKRNVVELFNNDNNLFNRQHDNNLKKIAKMEDLFYRDNKSGLWTLNKIGDYRLWQDENNFQKIINEFDVNGKFAFIGKQLEWLEQSHTLSEDNFIEDVQDMNDVSSLEKYLENIIGKKLFDKEQQELSDLIIKELTIASNSTDYRTKKLKPSTIEVILREQLELEYAVSKTQKESKGEMRGKRYIIITKLDK